MQHKYRLKPFFSFFRVFMMGFNYTSTDWSEGIWSINLQAYLGSTDEGVNVTSRITSFPDQANTDSRVSHKLIYSCFSRNFYRFKSCFALWQSSHFLCVVKIDNCCCSVDDGMLFQKIYLPSHVTSCPLLQMRPS